MNQGHDQSVEQTSVSKQQVSCFHTTHWSVVLMAAGRSSVEADQAMAELCQAYWMPLYTYVRCHIDDPTQAEDLTQTFFAKLLEKDYLRSADPAKGRFRAFLLTAMKRLMANERDRHLARRRGGGNTTLSLDFEAANVHFGKLSRETLSAEKMFMRDWVTAADVVDELNRLLQTDAQRFAWRVSHAKLKLRSSKKRKQGSRKATSGTCEN